MIAALFGVYGCVFILMLVYFLFIDEEYNIPDWKRIWPVILMWPICFGQYLYRSYQWITTKDDKWLE